MKPVTFIAFLSFLFILGCGKKNKDPEQIPEEATPVSDTGFKCGDLPPTPKNFGWQDTLTNGNKCIHTFFFNPVNADEIIYIVNGDEFGTNKMFNYNIPSGTTTYLANVGNYLPRINSKGWIVYSDLDNNIWKIKSKGDSLTQLTADKHSFDPVWDYSGNYIYYFAEASGSVGSQLMKVSAGGQYVNSFPQDLANTAAFRKSDRILYQKVKNNTNVSVTLRNMQTSSETELISGPKESKSGQANFDNLGLDNTDENFYWSNSNGIFRCNIATLKIDTLYKNCQNMIYNNPVLSLNSDELCYSLQTIKPVSPYKLLHVYKALVYNLANKQNSELKIFP